MTADPNSEGAAPSLPSRYQRRRPIAAIVNCVLVVLSLCVVAVPAEFVFRHRYGHMLYTVRPAVAAVQQYLTLDPVIGFKWKPNISSDQHVRFTINDIEPGDLVTDSFGVINTENAIAALANGVSPEVIGLGDSFMEMANKDLYERLGADGISFYSLAIHRQSPPQYGSILATWGTDLRPKTVLYGLFENDFNETSDYYEWRRSGVDWFAYHSGTWCGPPVGVGTVQRVVRSAAKGWLAFARVMDAKVRGERVTVAGPTADEVRLVSNAVREAAEYAKSAGIRFILVLIPSKESATSAMTAEARAYDDVVAAIERSNAEIVDLRTLFRENPEPATLYYEQDGHWNDRGIALACDAIQKLFKE